jgi:hypothetical protein
MCGSLRSQNATNALISPFVHPDMPLLQPTPHLTQAIYNFLDQCDRDSSSGAHNDLVDALYAWAGPRLQREQGRSSTEPLPPIPFTLLKQLYHALGGNAAMSLWCLTKGCTLILQSPHRPLPHPDLLQVSLLLCCGALVPSKHDLTRMHLFQRRIRHSIMQACCPLPFHPTPCLFVHLAIPRFVTFQLHRRSGCTTPCYKTYRGATYSSRPSLVLLSTSLAAISSIFDTLAMAIAVRIRCTYSDCSVKNRIQNNLSDEATAGGKVRLCFCYFFSCRFRCQHAIGRARSWLPQAKA